MSARPKVLFALPTMNAGGAERVMITLANHLNTEKFEPEFLAVRDNGPMRTLLSGNIPFHTLGHTKIFQTCLYKLWKALKTIDADIIFSTQAHMNFAVLICAFFLKKRPHIIIREAISPSYFLTNTLRGHIVRICYKLLYPKADIILAPAEMIIDEFQNILTLKTNSCQVMYNPVDPERVTCQHSTKTADRKIKFVCAGRLHWQKGYDLLVDALTTFKPGFDWSLEILGDGEEYDLLNLQIKRCGLEGKITLAGYEASPWQKIAEADCLLLPSRAEGLPNVVLESLSLGTPVIASVTAGGIVEIQSRSPDGAVQIVKNMNEFTQMMAKTTLKESNASLLGKEFELTYVCRQLEMLFEKTYSSVS